MRLDTVVNKVYKFKELSEEAKQKAIDDLRYTQVDYDWWVQDDYYVLMARDYGLEVDMSQINFDLERGAYVAFETFDHSYSKKPYTKGIYIEDMRKFTKKAGLRWNSRKYEGITVEHKHYAGGMIANYLDFSGTELALTDTEEDKLESCLQNFLDQLLDILRRSYEGMLEDQAVIETIEANDYEFTEHGRLY